MKKAFLLCFFGMLTALVETGTLARACSVCISGADDATADAFNTSVLFLMSTPYLVVGSIAGALFLVYRRSRTKREQRNSGEPLVQLAGIRRTVEDE